MTFWATIGIIFGILLLIILGSLGIFMYYIHKIMQELMDGVLDGPSGLMNEMDELEELL